jgi:hypothetical protein
VGLAGTLREKALGWLGEPRPLTKAYPHEAQFLEYKMRTFVLQQPPRTVEEIK